MLPVVALGRHCCSLATNLENYCPLVGDEMTNEIRDLARRPVYQIYRRRLRFVGAAR
jgi:hypothetical protein